MNCQALDLSSIIAAPPTDRNSVGAAAKVRGVGQGPALNRIPLPEIATCGRDGCTVVRDFALQTFFADPIVRETWSPWVGVGGAAALSFADASYQADLRGVRV